MDVKVVAKTRVKAGSILAEPGQAIAVPRDEAEWLARSGAVEIVPDSEFPEYVKLGSTELRKRAALIDEARQRRREALAEVEAQLAEARRGLKELEARQEMEGADVRKDVAKQEARGAELERAARAKRAALDVEVDRTEDERRHCEEALPQAIALEAEAERKAEHAAVDEKVLEARRRTVRAYAELANALQAERDAMREFVQVRRRHAAATGVPYSREPIVVEVDGRNLREILDFLPKLAETQRCSLIPRIHYRGSSASEFTVELEEAGAGGSA